MKNVTILALLVFFTSVAPAQDLAQNIRGKVTDQVTGLPLAGAGIKVVSSSGQTTASTSDQGGNFTMTVPLGRYRLSISFTGYESYEDELLVVAGREATLNVALHASETVLEAVEIGAPTIDDVPGLQSISIEKTLRVPANFFDPVRMVTSYPGVVAASDQNNSIIVRGNSPNGLLWRLNGLNIVNPNHLANAGTLSDRPAANGGGVNILSAQMLDRTDFYTGAFPTNYGNVLAGVVDMNLRDGNKSEHEFTAQASLIGLDFAAEGPVTKNGNNAFLANYRYSTVGLLSQMGVNFGDEAITFQDLSFHTSFDQANGGNVSLFGLWGQSRNEFNAKEPNEREEDKDLYDILYESQTYAVGANYMVPLSAGKLFIGAAYSSATQDRNADLNNSILPQQRRLLSDNYRSGNGLFSSAVNFEIPAGENSSLKLGMMTDYIINDLTLTKELGCFICEPRADEHLDGTVEGFLLQPYAEFNAALSSLMDINAGLRYAAYTGNDSDALEPRAQLIVKPSDKSTFSLAYSLTSQLQLPQVYLAEGNEDLDLTRSHHADVDYRYTIGNGLMLRAGLFYQLLFNVPIGQNLSSTFSALNLIEATSPANLVNEGTGENYGIDLTLEKYFFGKHYMLAGGSYYDSKYTGADGVKRDTRFNGNYTLNAVYGREWTKAAKNRTIGLNTRLLYLGGLRESSINVSESENRGETIYDTSDPFNNKFPDYFRLDLSISFRKNKPGYTRTFAIDIQNITGQQNESYHYYDFVQQKIVTKYQLGIIPVLVYRINF